MTLYHVGGKRRIFTSLQDAVAAAERIYKRTGIIVAVEVCKHKHKTRSMEVLQ